MIEQKNHKPVVLVVLDGWGEGEGNIGNPIAFADLPTIEQLNKNYPKLLLEASGLSVGLPWGVFGNSEIGHQTMGSGQIIYHFLPTINIAIQAGTFFNNQVLLKTANWAKEKKSSLHLIGLVSDGAVHSHIDHLFALLELCKRQGLNEVFVHFLSDGRDTPPNCAKMFLTRLQKFINECGVGKIATISGRFYAMDRNKNYDRVERALDAFINGEGIKTNNPSKAIDEQYQRNISDEFLEPIIIVDEKNNPIGQIKDDDAVIFFNFRGDRARELSRAFIKPETVELKKVRIPKVKFIGFAQYEEDLNMEAIFSPQKITTRVGEILSQNYKKQLRIAETEKFAHVTYFFNGGISEPFPGEDRIFIPSKNVSSYATIPEMSAREMTEKVINAIKENKYDFILINYANPDMVGHTGDFNAGIKAVEVVDECLSKLIDCVLRQNGCLVITADHGNVEEMINLETGEKDTKHSTNPVPCWFVTPNNTRPREITPFLYPEPEGLIADIAPTILELLNIGRPEEMRGISLLQKLTK
jgi:2,3-bisphosphoglycerate-independent phosphoglycerate mutase